MGARLSDRVELDPEVRPAEVMAILRDTVELAWAQSGNDARCNVYATWLGWLLQEAQQDAANLQALSSEIDNRDEIAKTLRARIDTLTEQHAEMLAALKLAADIIGHPDDDGSKLIAEVIAKAEGH